MMQRDAATRDDANADVTGTPTVAFRDCRMLTNCCGFTFPGTSAKLPGRVTGIGQRSSHRDSRWRRSMLILIAVFAMRMTTTLANGIPESGLASYEYTATEVNAAAEADLAHVLAPMTIAETVNQSAPQFARVRQLFSRVIAVALQKSALARTLVWRVYMHDGPLAEAYSRSNGKLVISARFLERYQPNDAELAFVIGHEVAHVLCEHERMNLSLVWRMNGPQKLLPRYAMEFLDTEPMVRARLAPVIRLQERVADRIGLELASASGIDSIRALGFFDKSAEKDRSGIFPDAHDLPGARKDALHSLAITLQNPLPAFRLRPMNCAP